MNTSKHFTKGALVALFLLCASAGFAAGAMKISLGERYTGGETVLIKIALAAEDGSPLVLENPSRIKIDIKKPDGNVVKSEARHGGWNAPGEYFDVYTIDYMGAYKVTASDPETGASATAAFDSVFITPSSLGVIIFAVVLIIACIIYWSVASKKKKEAGT